MDIKKEFFDLVKNNVEEVYDGQLSEIQEVASLFVCCMVLICVVQLFGVKHGEEFVNELNYRAGGIALYHALRLKDLVLLQKIDQKDVDDSSVYEDRSVADKFNEVYVLDERDMYCLVSFYGNEPLVLELAKRAKQKGQKVVGIVNKRSYDAHEGKLLEYCDAFLDMGANEPDIALCIEGVKAGQLSSTVSNVMAQMLTGEVYRYFVTRGLEAPVLLSANINGADVHNNSLTDPYGRRIR